MQKRDVPHHQGIVQLVVVKEVLKVPGIPEELDLQRACLYEVSLVVGLLHSKSRIHEVHFVTEIVPIFAKYK